MGIFFNTITKSSIYLLSLLVPVAFSPWAFEGFEFAKQYVLFFLVAIGCVAWLTKMVVVDKEVSMVRTQLDKAILLFLAVVAVSSVFSQDPVSSVLGSYGRFSNGLIGIASLVLFYVLLVNHTASDAKSHPQKIPVSRLLRLFVFSITIVVFVWYASLFGMAGMHGSLNLGGGSQEGLAIFLAAFLPFLISRISLQRLFDVWGLWSAAFVLLSFVVLLVVDFAMAWIVFILSLLLLLFLRIWQRVRVRERVSVRRILPILVFAFIAFVSLFAPVEFSLPFPAVPKDPVLSQGISWGVALENAKENWKNALVGSGPATFGISFSEHRPALLNETPEWQTRFDRAGSTMAEALSTLGLLGLAFLLALAGLFFAISAISILYLVTRKALAKAAYEEQNTAFLVLVFGLFVSQFFYYQNTLLAFSFWFALALGVVSFEQGMSELNISLRKYLEIALVARGLLLGLVAALVFAFLFGTRIYIADATYKKAFSMPSSQAALSSKIDLMTRTVALNPWQGEYKLYLSQLFFERAQAALLLGEEEQDKAMIALDVQKAIAYVQGATQVASNRVVAWEQLGALYQELGSAPGAAEWGIRAYEEAVALEPTNPVLYNELAKAYAAKEDFGKAREQVEKAISLKPNFLQAQKESVLLYEKQGDMSAARKLLEALVLQYPGDADLLFQLGKMYYNMKETARAILQFEEAVRLAPNHSNAHYALGLAYEDAGEAKKAIGEFERVLELNPENEEVSRRLEKLR